MKIEEYKHYFLVDGVKIHWNFKLLPKGFEAITLFGHVFDVRQKDDLFNFISNFWDGKIMVNHERIHIMQAESFKLKYFTFYLIYIAWWIKGLFHYRFDGDRSYYKIPFEQEAYANEKDFDYNKVNWKAFKW